MKRITITLSILLLSIVGNAQVDFQDTCLLEMINLNYRKGKQELTFYSDLYHVTKNHNNSMIVFPETITKFRGFKISGISNIEYGTNDTIRQTAYDTTRYKDGCDGTEVNFRIQVDDSSMICIEIFDILFFNVNDQYRKLLSDTKINNIVFTITKHTFTRKHRLYRKGDNEIEFFYVTMFVF